MIVAVLFVSLIVISPVPGNGDKIKDNLIAELLKTKKGLDLQAKSNEFSDKRAKTWRTEYKPKADPIQKQEVRKAEVEIVDDKTLSITLIFPFVCGNIEEKNIVEITEWLKPIISHFFSKYLIGLGGSIKNKSNLAFLRPNFRFRLFLVFVYRTFDGYNQMLQLPAAAHKRVEQSSFYEAESSHQSKEKNKVANVQKKSGLNPASGPVLVLKTKSTEPSMSSTQTEDTDPLLV